MSIGVAPLHEFFRAQNRLQTKKWLFVLATAIVGYQVFMFAFDYFFIYPTQSASEWQQGYKDIVLAVDQNRNRYDQIWINPEDDRFFLWYLAYGKITPDEIQALMQHELILKKWENVEFQEFPWDRYQTAVRPFIVVTRADALQKKPTREKIVLDSLGNAKFEIGFYEKDE
jgi:hypothetical protein